MENHWFLNNDNIFIHPFTCIISGQTFFLEIISILTIYSTMVNMVSVATTLVKWPCMI